MDLITSILGCLGLNLTDRHNVLTENYDQYPHTDEKNAGFLPYHDCNDPHINDLAAKFVHELLNINEVNSATRSELESLFFSQELSRDEEINIESWYEYFAAVILGLVETAIRTKIYVSAAVKDAAERATLEAQAVGFIKEHPIFCTLVAIGVLAIIAPWVLEALGFAELGPIEGSWAALWQSRYAGYVPKGSLFSMLQRLGMTWTH